MKTLLFAAAALSTAALTAPASAAPARHTSVDAQQHRISERIERGFERGVLTARETRSLRGELHQIARLEARYAYTGGINRWEHRDLMNRLSALDARVRSERRDDDRRYAGGDDWRHDDWGHDGWRDGRRDGRY